MRQIQLSTGQWQFIKQFLEATPRKRQHSLERIVEAIFYLVKTGCQWRMLPTYYPKWQLVYYYFSKWRDSGIIEELLHKLREYLRIKKGKKAGATLGIVDSQSVKSGCNNAMKGFDGNKKVNGRKRHIVVDSNGWLLAVLVHNANLHDSTMAIYLFRILKEAIHRITVILADGGYRGKLIENTKIKYGYILKIIPKAVGNVVSPNRWIVERTFAWFSFQRRLSLDYEYLNETAEAMVQLAAINILARKI